MCDLSKGFKLCTCDHGPIIHHKNKKKYKRGDLGNTKLFKWRLLRYVRTEFSGMLGIVRMPLHDLGNGLTEEFFVQKLNSENCFDFEYVPKERDTLSIRESEHWDVYIAFTFTNGRWIIGKGYDPFSDIMKDIGEGKLKPINPNEDSGSMQ